MNATHNQTPRRRILRSAAAIAVCAGVIVAPRAVASAAEATNAFAYQVVDCSTPGTDYGVALGTPDKPIGAVSDSMLRASAYNGAAFVMPIQLRAYEEGSISNPSIRWATVPPDTAHTFVRFEWEQDGNMVYLNTPSPKPEVCDGPSTTSGPTTDPGPGLTPIAPVRLRDTRDSSFAKVGTDQWIKVKVAGANGVPANATSAMLNVTAADPSAPGFLTVYPCGVDVPKTSSVNFIQGETRAGGAFTKIGSDGFVCVYASAPTHIVVDLNGYVADSTSPTAMTPIRVVDTRPGELTDVAGTPKGKTTQLRLPASKFGVADASNLIVNITTVGADAPGHVFIDECGGEESVFGQRASVVNYAPGRAQANMAIIHPLADDVCISASAPTHMVVDLVGATSGASQLLGGSPAEARLLDTRPGSKTSDGAFQGGGMLKANVPLKLKVRDRLNADGATAAALNVTAANESDYGHITVYPCGSAAPTASNLNYVPGVAIANLAFAKLDADGNVCIVSHVDTHLVVDLAAVNTTKIQSANWSALFGPDSWVWGPVTGLQLWGQVGGTLHTELQGAAPPYSLTGPSISGLSTELTPSGTMVVTLAEDEYVIANPKFVLSDADGHTQTVSISLKVDPQFKSGTLPIE